MYKSDHGALLWKFATFYFDIQHNLIVLAHISCKAIMTNNVSMENQITKLSK